MKCDITLGTAGYIAAKLPDDIVSELTPIYIQCGTSVVAFLIATCETIAIVTLVRWMKWKMNIDKRRQSEIVSNSKLLPECLYDSLSFSSVAVHC